MALGDNNPRVFAETISLDAWRTPFDGKIGEADLHIDVSFNKKGRIGGHGSPVRFRLSLKRAEIHVIRDSEGIIDIRRSAVRRASLPDPSKRERKLKNEISTDANINATLSLTSGSLNATAAGKHHIDIVDTITGKDEIYAMSVRHWSTDRGYGFRIAASDSGALDGQPWPANERVMAIHDTKSQRKRGEPPEVRIEIHCLREDLLIESIEFVDENMTVFERLTRSKKTAVEQYIKDELARAGFPCGDLTEPFTRLILADVIPTVEP